MERSLAPEEYLKSRLEDQIGWYDKKSTRFRKVFLWLRWTEVVAAALIPLISGFAKTGQAGVLLLVGLLGVLIAVCTGTASLLQAHERWIEYRTTAESLKKEKYLFLTRTEPYDGENPFPLLVQRAETLISKENTNWAQYMMKLGKGEKRG